MGRLAALETHDAPTGSLARESDYLSSQRNLLGCAYAGPCFYPSLIAAQKVELSKVHLLITSLCL